MTEFLLFTLQAPLASWGEIAVGEWRGSWDRPSRSAIIGVMGAVLGVDRDDADGQRALIDGYRIGVRSDARGTTMHDYHTMQSVSKAALKRRTVVSRADILSIPDHEKETILSRREYRTDVVCTIAVWCEPGARWQLVDIASALRHPVFTPFAGRRSNPLGLPMAPEVVRAASLAAAFQARPTVSAGILTLLPGLRPRTGWGQEVAYDQCVGFPSGLVEPIARIVRRDVPVNRRGWLFGERIVCVGALSQPGAET